MSIRIPLPLVSITTRYKFHSEMDDWQATADWASHVNAWHDCIRCPIGEKATNHVFGRGSLPCDILFIAEAPGAEEDKSGYALVGASGGLVQKLIENTPSLNSRSYYMMNTVMCRPTDEDGKNRPPSNLEASNCTSRARQQIELARPKAIICLGRIAENWWRTEQSLSNKAPVLYSYHPSYIIRAGGLYTKSGIEWQESIVKFINGVFNADPVHKSVR